MKETSKASFATFLKWFIWILSVSFFFYDYLLRVFPSILIDSLMSAYSIDAGTVGLIIGIYFYTYGPMQFPVGLLVDRFGAQYLLVIATLICGVSTFSFPLSPNVEILAITRLFIGFGSAFAFVGMLYFTSHWFPHRIRGLLIGIANSAAMIGAASGEGPLSIVENAIGWRWTVILLGGIGLIIAGLMFWAVRQQPKSLVKKSTHSKSWAEAWKFLKKVLSHPRAWINAIVGLLLYATTTGFGALWGVNFLQHIHGISLEQAGFAISMLYIGWMVGGPLIGHLADRYFTRRVLILACSILGFFVIGTIIYLPGIHFAAIYIFLFLLGFFSSCELLTFGYAIELFHKKATASSVAFTNFLATMGGAFFQPFVGWMLDLFWSGDYVGGIKAYSVEDYQLAMTCFPISFALAFVLAFFLKPPKELKLKKAST